MKRYLEYLELFGYFAQPGHSKLSREDFDIADARWREIAARHPELSDEERAELAQLKAILYRDKP
jgi:hypothetical protein